MQAQALLGRKGVEVEVDSHRTDLLIDVTVVRESSVGRAVVEREHTRLARLERDGHLVGGEASQPEAPAGPSVREAVAGKAWPP
ncbi:MAG: hypothetical protein ABSH53_09275 [Holophaga sp.]